MPRRPPVEVAIPMPERELEQSARALERKIARRGEAVAGNRDITTSSTQEAKTPGMRGVPRVRDKDGEEMRQTTLHLPVPLFKRLGQHCVEHDRGMSETIGIALTRFLDEAE